ncbi:profilin [Trichoderma chlorosporum]
MSWQAFVDTSLVGTGHITKGAIISLAGDSVWATSTDLALQPAELKVIASLISKDQSASDKAFAEGLHVGGVRYVVARNEDEAIYARAGREGVVISPSKQAIVLGIHGEATQAGPATMVVTALADHLKKTGY